MRSYEPEGRWLQPDPSEQDGVRTYVYVGDDPVDTIDPSGLFSVCNVWIIGYFACAQKLSPSTRATAAAPFALYKVIYRRNRPVALDIVNGSEKTKGDFGELRSKAFMKLLGYEYRGGSGRGIDGIYERVSAPTIEVPPPLALRLQLYRWIVVEAKSFGSHYRMTRNGRQFTVGWIRGSNRMRNAVGPQVARQLEEEGYGRMEIRAAATGDVEVTEFIPVSGTVYKIPMGLPAVSADEVDEPEG